jgi:hypothetical protein
VASHRRARPRRSLVLLAAALLLVALAIATAAAGQRLYDAYFGRPAPQTVEHALARLSARGRTLPPPFRSDPGFLVSRTRGLLQVRTAAGPVDLWEVPLRRGGSCVFVQADARSVADRRPPAAGPCAVAGAARVPVLWAVVAVPVGSGSARLLEGHVSRLVRTVELSGGRRLPLAHGYFLAPAPARADALVARDASGRVVARTRLSPVAGGRSFAGIPLPTEALLHAPLVLQVTTGAGSVVLATARGAESCADVYDGSGTVSHVCAAGPGRISLGIAMMSGWALYAYLGRGAASAQVAYADGSTRPLPVVDGWVLHALERANPVRVTARRADGSLLASAPIALP